MSARDGSSSGWGFLAGICIGLVVIIIGGVLLVKGLFVFTAQTGTTRTSTSTTVGKHNIEIVHNSGGGHFGKSTHSSSSGKDVYVYERGDFKVRLEGEMLTVNGERYPLANEEDDIRIEDGQVYINGAFAKPHLIPKENE